MAKASAREPRSRASEELTTATPEPWGGVWERLAGAADGLMGEVAADREQAPALLTELLAAPPAVREHLAVTLERFHSPALAALLAAAGALDEGAECLADSAEPAG